MTPDPTKAEIEAMLAQHVRVEPYRPSKPQRLTRLPYCDGCEDQDWPCPVAQVARMALELGGLRGRIEEWLRMPGNHLASCAMWTERNKLEQAACSCRFKELRALLGGETEVGGG